MVSAQITDDSTELVYGPSTVQFVLESDLLKNTEELHYIDSSIHQFENYSLVDQTDHFYQNLGNLGTPVFSVFYEPQKIIGRTSGFSNLDPYFADPETFRYYNTKSPFIDVMAVFAGQNRSRVNLTFTQNIKPHWNFGANIRRITADKQIGADRSEGDRNVVSAYFDMFSYYEHPGSTYKMLFYFANLNHQIDETGGILVSDSATRAEKFLYQNSNIRLEDAQNQQQSQAAHLYQEYALLKQFQLYQRLDWQRQINTYTDFNENQTLADYNFYTGFYDRFLLDEDSTYEQIRFSSVTNEVGLKGVIASVYYRFYLKSV
jgi:hypothetical protein